MSSSIVTLADRQPLARLAAFNELAKPRLTAMVLVTVAVGMLLGSWGSPDMWLLGHTLLGAALLAASTGAWNQLLEADCDRLMQRTCGRPIPSGRLSGGEVAWFGGITLALGLAYLAWLVNPRSAVVGVAAWSLYVLIYTPLKRHTTANTAIGAVSGALPAMIGWAATGTALRLEIAVLFVIIYLWQFPHFMAIAWRYRDDYARAGLKMHTVVDPTGRRSGRLAVSTALVLLPVSLLPAWFGVGSRWGALVYGVSAAILGAAYLATAVRFRWRLDDASARTLMRMSLVYLPTVLLLWIFLAHH